MSTVYVALVRRFNPCRLEYVVGVFSSEELAEAACEARSKELKALYESGEPTVFDEVVVVDYELDPAEGGFLFPPLYPV